MIAPSSQPSGASSSSSSRQQLNVINYCSKCNVPLAIVDDIPSIDTVDLHKSFATMLESFVVLAGAASTLEASKMGAGGGNGGYHDAISRVERILDLASGQADATHPLCVDCVDQVLEEAQKQAQEAEEEKKAYQAALQALENEQNQHKQHGSSAGRQLEDEIHRLEEEERHLLREIESVDHQLAALHREESTLQAEMKQLHEDEHSFWTSFSDYQSQVVCHEEEVAATNAAIHYATRQLQRLKTMNVINDTFHIWQDGPFGTINGFRLGKLLHTPVSWDEINAAWGQVCLLLDVVTKKCRLQLQKYRLLPRGSYSAIIRKHDKATLELYGSEGGLSRFFSGRRFDQAMVAFLDCVQEVANMIHRRGDPTARIPFKIDGDKIEGFPIRLQFNQEERSCAVTHHSLPHTEGFNTVSTILPKHCVQVDEGSQVPSH